MIKDAIAIICTRPESKRLPGKVFKKIAGVPALEYILKRITPHIQTVLAVPYDLAHYAHPSSKMWLTYENLANSYVAQLWGGDPASPLHRMANFLVTTMDTHKWIVRITHDDILIDPQTMIDLIEECKKQDAGYGITPEIVEGAGVEVIRRENLLAAAERHKEPTEFVSYFVQGKGLPFPNVIHLRPRESIRRSYRLTMDYLEDAQVLDIVLRQVGPSASVDQICRFIDMNPYVMGINHQPKLTIYTCAYNAARWIALTIKSVLALENIDFEYLLIDDGSTDETPLIMSQYVYDKRVKIILNETNVGLASSSNVAIDNAKGKYIMRVDADDILLADRFSEMYEMMSNNNYAAIYPAYQENYGSLGQSHEVFLPNVYHHVGCTLMDKRILNEMRFKDGLRCWDSLELYTRLIKKAPISYFPSTVFYYTQHDKSLSKTDPAERKKVLKEIINGNS